MFFNVLLFFLSTICFVPAPFINYKSEYFSIEPSFRINFKNKGGFGHTKDKPQSKLWYMDNYWWAILPGEEGPLLWQRTSEGWIEHEEIYRSLKGIPGQADVWYENRQATAVGVSDSALCIFRLKPKKVNDVNGQWQAEVLSYLDIPHIKPKIETATIVKDNSGVWWVAADVGENSIYVWNSEDSKKWSKPLLIGNDIDPDDISCITAIRDKVIVLWSNQKHDAIYAREHINGQAGDQWSDVIVVESGGDTADDHINTAVSPDGTLWVVTKNEIDKAGYPNLVLRVREPNGHWKNYPYLIREQYLVPSRPVVITTPDQNLILTGHTLYNYKERNKGQIIFGIVDTTSSNILVNSNVVIDPKDTSKNLRINDITGPKHSFPPDAPWIILASNVEGYIHEADLRLFLKNN